VLLPSGSARLAPPSSEEQVEAHPERTDYGSFAFFNDPDGNVWVLQEVRTRAPGR